jgi:hypothetical protein
MSRMRYFIYIPIILIILFIHSLCFANPPKSIDIIVPQYKVVREAGFDYIDIPKGEILLIDGMPRVPYYTFSTHYPHGYKIQNVMLKQKSGLKTQTGLTLPTVKMIPGSPGGELSEKMAQKGWYPDKDFEWKIWEEPDGGSNLIILMYPFYYNAETLESKFYANYKFDIEYVYTQVSVTSLTTDKYIYDPGENVGIKINFANQGDSQDVILFVTVKKEISDEVIFTFPQKSIKKLSGKDSISVTWEPKKIPTGDYMVEAKLKDEFGNILDSEIYSFRVGKILGKVHDFSVLPEYFSIGDKIKLSLKFENAGSCDLNGNCIFQIKEGKKTIKDTIQEFTDLQPGKFSNFSYSWDTKDAKKGAIYHIFGYVYYNGTATPAEYRVVSTNHFPNAEFTYSPEKPRINEEITFDGSGSTDEDGKIVKFDWNFGDGGVDTGKIVTHAYSLPGNYRITLTVKDNQEATDKITLNIPVEE